MKKFLIPVTWQMYGFIETEAESLDDAINKVDDDSTPLPDDASYIEGSFEVDHAAIDAD